MERAYHIEAKVQFLRTEDGGRTTPVRSNYSSLIGFENRYWGALFDFPNVEEIEPGQTGFTRILFFFPEQLRGRIRSGMPFDVLEGTRAVGRGTVTGAPAI